MRFRLVAALILAALALQPAAAQSPGDSKLYQHARPAIVGITCEVAGRGTYFGTGTIVHPDGFIMTSTTVVPVGQREAKILLSDGRSVLGQVVKQVAARELVVLRIPGRDHQYLPLAAPESVKIAQRCYTIGNAYQMASKEGKMALCAGSVSGLYSMTDNANNESKYRGEVIECTAAISPGVDGGPLINGRGEVIGLLSLGFSKARYLGVAIPVDHLRGDFTKGNGNSYDMTLAPSHEGLNIRSVVAAGAAARAGLKAGDRIIQIAGQPANLANYRAALAKGRTLELEVARGPWSKEVSLRPSNGAGGLGLVWPAEPRTITPPPAEDAATRIWQRALKRVASSVVTIQVERDPAAPAPKRNPFSRRPAAEARPQTATSGVIVRANGLILTSAYNIEGAKRILVRLGNGQEYGADVIGVQKNMDLALIKIDADAPLPVPSFGAPIDLAPGTLCGSVGRSLGSPTLTTGIISATGRQRGSCYQADALMNYGNTGGALINTRGEVIGINAFIGHRFRWGQSSGVGFAVTMRKIKEVLPALEQGKTVNPMPVLGVRSRAGSLVLETVAPNSAAARAGLRPGDKIISVNGQALKGWGELVKLIRTRLRGDTLKITIEREGKTLKLNATL